MRKTVNDVKIVGYVYGIGDSNGKDPLSVKTSKKGVTYIGGTLQVQVDTEGVNIVPVKFIYVPDTKPEFDILEKIITTEQFVSTVGVENATPVSIRGNIGLDVFPNRDDPTKMIEAPHIAATKITVLREINKLNNEFITDMLITNVVENPMSDEDALPTYSVKGAIFTYKKELLPITFTMSDVNGADYLSNAIADGGDGAVFIKVWGSVNTYITSVQRETDAGFGAPIVDSYFSKKRIWNITGAARDPYVIGDEAVGVTFEEIEEMKADKEVRYAGIRADYEERQAKRNGAPATAAPAPATTKASTPAYVF